MNSHTGSVFVQVGATRDGLDPYLNVARKRSLSAVLVETPAYLRWRRQLGRSAFDVEIAVEHPADPEEVRAALEPLRPRIALMLPGFERYTASTYAAAELLGVPPQDSRADVRFAPLDKSGQRAALDNRAPGVLQPRYLTLPVGPEGGGQPLEHLGLPLVIKPSDGGGGLGVFIVEEPAQRDHAIAQIRAMTNYDGGAFSQIVLEEYVRGTEHSIQAVAHRGRAFVLTTCEKIILRERSRDPNRLVGFREVAHIASHGALAPQAFQDLAQRCLDATGYRSGPFHIDLIENARGVHFVEMGFRLSGAGIVALVRRVTDMDWAELSVASHLDGREPALTRPPQGEGAIVGQATLASEDELRAAEQLRARGVRVEVQRFAAPAGGAGGADEDPSLTSDLLRHTGFVGRVVLHARHPDEARANLRHCIATRLED
ncbi:ATP-grasp domain-containing protein [Sorangium sp. So ce1389]|uniref:ATP-grasp domain-containing protein n=1 Tax=Sorangium sp. So ce1389 TaxID=3133336 RepID=UPI003F62C8CA